MLLHTGLLTLMLMCGNCLADATLDSLKGKFSAALSQYEKDAEADQKTLELQYFAAMDKLEKHYQAEGELEPVIALRKEKERYHAEKTLDADTLSNVKALRDLQETFLAQKKQIPINKSKKVINLRDQYALALENYQKKLTRENKLDIALQVKSERDAISAIDQVSEAEFIIAELGPEKQAESQQTPPPAKKEPPEPVAEARGDIPHHTSVAKKWSGDADNYIRRRFNDYIHDLEDRKIDEALEYVDPEFRKEHGDGIARAGLGMLAGIASRVDREPGAKLSVASVSVSEDETTAKLIPKLYLNNTWRDLAPQNWVLREGDWFIQISPENQNDLRNADRQFERMDHDRNREERRAWKRHNKL
jgi:hypothetical protein